MFVYCDLLLRLAIRRFLSRELLSNTHGSLSVTHVMDQYGAGRRVDEKRGAARRRNFVAVVLR